MDLVSYSMAGFLQGYDALVTNRDVQNKKIYHIEDTVKHMHMSLSQIYLVFDKLTPSLTYS